jgi:CRP/FNR family transcriptional regulator
LSSTLPSRLTPADRDAILMRGRWFAGLPAVLRRELLQRSEIRQFRRGSLLYMQGDPSRGLWGVLEGDLSFSRMGPNGSELLYHVGGPSMWFGILGVLTGLPMPVSVAAVTDVTMIFVRRSDILDIIEHEPRHTLRLVKLPLTRGIDLIEMAEHIVRPSPRSRVASRLLLLARMADEEDGQGAGRPLRVSQSQLAAMTALSRQSVSRVLHELADTGAIKPGFRQVAITDPQLLESLASAQE